MPRRLGNALGVSRRLRAARASGIWRSWQLAVTVEHRAPSIRRTACVCRARDRGVAGHAQQGDVGAARGSSCGIARRRRTGMRRCRWATAGSARWCSAGSPQERLQLNEDIGLGRAEDEPDQSGGGEGDSRDPAPAGGGQDQPRPRRSPTRPSSLSRGGCRRTRRSAICCSRSTHAGEPRSTGASSTWTTAVARVRFRAGGIRLHPRGVRDGDRSGDRRAASPADRPGKVTLTATMRREADATARVAGTDTVVLEGRALPPKTERQAAGTEDRRRVRGDGAGRGADGGTVRADGDRSGRARERGHAVRGRGDQFPREGSGARPA